MPESRGRRALVGAVAVAVVILIGVLVWLTVNGISKFSQVRDISSPAAFAEPVKLSSFHGVLDVTLTAKQGTADLDTVAEPVTNALVFSYQINTGTSSNGKLNGANLYPAPTLRVNPGEKLVLRLQNDMGNLSIADFQDPAFVAAGDPIPAYPPALTSAPINNHLHGLHVSPSGQSDNVLISIPAGQANTYSYAIPKSMPQGLYWYHSHRHQVTAAETYLGLAGLLQIGRSDGGIPAVTDNNLPVRNMALQYNYVFGRKEGLSQLNNINWPSEVSTLTPPTGAGLADGTYSPSLAPVNFTQSPAGTQYMTNWYEGPLSVDNNRGQFQFMPANLMSFASSPGQAAASVAADPSLPDRQRDLQYTVNGQFQPSLTARPGQTEIWALANISDFAYERIQLTETATGNHPQIKIVAQDGNPYPDVHLPTTDNGTTLLIPPGARYSIAVTMPLTGSLELGLPPGPNTPAAAPAGPQSGPGILYTSSGDGKAPATLGTISVEPSATSYYDGFFLFPTQRLLTVEPDTSGGTATTVDFADGQPLGAYTSFVDTSKQKPAVERTFTVSGGFANKLANENDPQSFVYEFNGNAFPYTPIARPRLGSVEKWTIKNSNNDQHPIHIHVNDFQVEKTVSPAIGVESGPQMWGQDDANLPAPLTDAQGNVTAEGILTLGMKFQDYTGTYVIHCHRLNHEDNGLMAVVNVIPEVSAYAVAEPGSPGSDAKVRLYDGAGDRLIRTVTPFPGYTGEVSVAMGDVNGDQVTDVIVGAGAGGSPDVVAYSGKPEPGARAFSRELTRFAAFDPSFTGGVSVASANIDGQSTGDNIVVGTGPGAETSVKIFRPDLRASDAAPQVFSSFSPYPGDSGGVALTAGAVDMSGRISIVTAPGPGSEAKIKTFSYSLFTPVAGATSHAGHHGAGTAAAAGPPPQLTSEFTAFDSAYTGGVGLATGLVDARSGGAAQIMISQLAGSGAVSVYSSGSALNGEPAMYLHSPSAPHEQLAFQPIATFAPFAGRAGGTRVATTSTTSSSDLVVSGTGASGAPSVRKYALAPGAAGTVQLAAKLIGEISSPAGSEPGTSPGAVAGF